MGGGDLPASSTYSGALSYHYPQAGLIRRSLPNMAHSMLVHEPAKIYPYHILLITNYRLPSDVDRCNLEVSRPWGSSPTCSHFNFMFSFAASLVRHWVRAHLAVRPLRVLQAAPVEAQRAEATREALLKNHILHIANIVGYCNQSGYLRRNQIETIT